MTIEKFGVTTVPPRTDPEPAKTKEEVKAELEKLAADREQRKKLGQP